MWLVFYISQSTLGTWLSEILAGWIEVFQGWVAGKVENASPILQAILVDGIIGGVGAVVGFLPTCYGYVLPHCITGGLRIHGACHSST